MRTTAIDSVALQLEEGIIDTVINGDGLTPAALRSSAQTLFDLADRIESARQKDGAAIRTETHLRLKSRQDRQAILRDVALAIYEQRKARSRFLDFIISSEPAWDILLDLYIHHVKGVAISVSSACLASNVPSTTALRYIDLLEEEGIVVRTASPIDARSFILALTSSGLRAMEGYLVSHLRRFEGFAAPSSPDFLSVG